MQGEGVRYSPHPPTGGPGSSRESLLGGPNFFLVLCAKNRGNPASDGVPLSAAPPPNGISLDDPPPPGHQTYKNLWLRVGHWLRQRPRLNPLPRPGCRRRGLREVDAGGLGGHYGNRVAGPRPVGVQHHRPGGEAAGPGDSGGGRRWGHARGRKRRETATSTPARRTVPTMNSLSDQTWGGGATFPGPQTTPRLISKWMETPGGGGVDPSTHPKPAQTRLRPFEESHWAAVWF